MRKFLLHIFLMTAMHSFGLAQDLIVTTAGDSIHCRISKIEKGYIHFTFMQGENAIQTLISMDEVKHHSSNHFDSSLIPPMTRKAPDSRSVLRGRFAGGGGYRLGKIDPDLPSLLKEYLEELKTGYGFGGELYFSKTEAIGYGGLLSVFKTGNEIASIGVKDDITILYAGPSVMTAMNYQGNYSLYSAISLGYLKYHNEGLIDGIAIDFDSATLGLALNLGLDFYLSETYGISLGLNLLRGQLTEMVLTSNGESETIELDEDSYESMNRLDFSFGIHFILD